MRAALAARSDCRKRQADDGIIAERGDGFQTHVASTLDSPFVVPFEEQGADQARHCVFVGQDANNLAAALGLAGTGQGQRCQAAPRILVMAAFSPSWASEINSLTPRKARRARERRNSTGIDDDHTGLEPGQVALRPCRFLADRPDDGAGVEDLGLRSGILAQLLLEPDRPGLVGLEVEAAGDAPAIGNDSDRVRQLGLEQVLLVAEPVIIRRGVVSVAGMDRAELGLMDPKAVGLGEDAAIKVHDRVADALDRQNPGDGQSDQQDQGESIVF